MATTALPESKHKSPDVNGVPRDAAPSWEGNNGEQRFVLDGISYASYKQIADALPEGGIRATFDHGRLELMTTSFEHESYDRSLSHLLNILTEELNIDIDCGGRMTLRQEDEEKGMEPDNCYWIQNEHLMRGKLAYDPAIDPPPDLAWEIEVSRSVLNRLGILAALKVPEVWRYDGDRIIVLLLNASGEYDPSPTSRAFPFLPVNELVRFLNMRATMSQTQIARAFREWVREQAAAGWPAMSAPGPEGPG